MGPEPVLDQVVCPLGIFVTCNIRDANVILIVLDVHGNFFVEDIDLCEGCVTSPA